MVLRLEYLRIKKGSMMAGHRSTYQLHLNLLQVLPIIQYYGLTAIFLAQKIQQVMPRKHFRL